MVNKKEEEFVDNEMLDLFEDVADHLSESVEEEEDIDTKIPKVDEEVSASEEDSEEDEDEQSELESQEDEQTESEDDDVEDEDDTEESSLFTPYAKFLVDEGVLSNLDIEKFDGTSESLKKAMADEIGYYVEQYKAQMPAEVKRILDGYEKGVPFDKMLEVTSDTIKYENIKDEALSENADLQKSLVKDYLNQTTKLSDAMKDKMISQWEDGLELEEQSKMALTELKSLQAQKEQDIIAQQEQEAAEYRQRQEETLANLDKYIGTTEEIIPNIKINQVMKDKIKQNLTVPVEYTQDGYPINALGKYMNENPIEGEFILNYIFEATDHFKNWDVLNKAGKRSAIKDLEKATKKLDSGSNKGTVSRKRAKHDDTLKGIASFLNQ